MGLFKKKETVPNVPAASPLPAFPSGSHLPPLPPKEEPIKRDLPELPSFPSSSKNENLNREMVKSAVSDLPSPGEKEEKEAPMSLPLDEPKKETMIPSRPTASIPEPPEVKLPSLPKKEESLPQVPKEEIPMPEVPKIHTPIPVQDEPIFVRIDKFQAAQKNFDKIKSKIEEMESVLSELEDVKAQEEEELKGWTENVKKLKSRLSEIDENIFSQI